MPTKYTLYSLCQSYDKIEIPIIQRDYAQGRKGQNNLRNKFVDYLLSALKEHTAIELDFVYGEERHDIAKDGKTKVMTFIPIDGQQRLTTLWLLHWFLAVKENRLAEISSILSKFTYETRPTAHDFCHQLTIENFPKDRITDIDTFIIDRKWFDPEWLNDSSIKGMLRMLRTFANSPLLNTEEICLDLLLEPHNLISFYFVPLQNFGLAEELYIRMNARGKVLTQFENFKSEFYKILRNNPRLDEIKDKMEYAWVSNLWGYRKPNFYVTDDCFMNYLQFITRMLYFKQAEYRSDKGYANNFIDFKLLNNIYSLPKNTDFLIFAIDSIPFLASQKDFPVIWTNTDKKLAFSDILSNCIRGEHMSIEQMFVLYAALVYTYKHQSQKSESGESFFCEQTNEFVRVIRNLIVNTSDKSEREHPRIINSIIELCNADSFTETIRNDGFNLKGFNDSQCAEENVKARIIQKYPSAKGLIHKIEDNRCFKGNIMNIIASVYGDKETQIKDFVFQKQHIDLFDEHKLENTYDVYKQLANDDFNLVWGDLLDSSLYTHHVSSGRLIYDYEYTKNSAIIAVAARYSISKFDSLDEFLIQEEKKFICNLSSKNEDLSQVRNVKTQLHLLYILCVRLMDCTIQEFFASGCYNFGWLHKETGYTSLFNQGINKDPWFSENNPIFQTYNSQFRYNMGLSKDHALPCEIVGNGKPQKAWDKLLDWANS